MDYKELLEKELCRSYRIILFLIGIILFQVVVFYTYVSSCELVVEKEIVTVKSDDGSANYIKGDNNRVEKE